MTRWPCHGGTQAHSPAWVEELTGHVTACITESVPLCRVAYSNGARNAHVSDKL